jgi:transketolase
MARTKEGQMAAFKDLANAIRFLAVDAVEKANSGHPGMPMGMADVATVLYRDFLCFNPEKPDWAHRDRFILSAGHGSMLLYALNYLTGYKEMTIEQLKHFRQLGSLTPGHPEVHVSSGIEMTTGPLGQGLATSVGFALAEEIQYAHHQGPHQMPRHKTYVICSDGDMQEGITHEACSLAGHLKLGNLIALYDSNNISIDGDTSLSFTEDVGVRFLAYGWAVDHADGHDEASIATALAAAQNADRPTLIICKTQIGHGSPGKANTHHAHGSPLGKDEVVATRTHLNWAHEPFHVPDDILNAWRSIGKRAAGRRICDDNGPVKIDLSKLDEVIASLKADFAAKKPHQATRKSSGDVLEKLVPALPALIGGSADLTPSNNTRTNTMTDIKPGDFSGRYVRYGIREHGMAAIMNGMALHGGIIPYSGTFLSFADYARPAIRLAALMKQRVVHVMTHDSIGLGEDGPTHQPVEHLAALRAIPNLQVLRPCDAVETAECWQMALSKADGPTILALSRQNLPALRGDEKGNLSAKGGYVLRDADNVKFTLVATGSEVSLAVEVFEALKAKSIPARVVSMPERRLFLTQPKDYQNEVLGEGRRIIIEAGSKQGWDALLGTDGLFFGVPTFGESAPYQDLYKHFGLTVENITKHLNTL